MKTKHIIIFAILVFVGVSCWHESGIENNAVGPNIIPDELVGSWMLDIPIGSEEPVGQTFRWVFDKKEPQKGRYEYYWIVTFPDFGPVVIGAEKGVCTVHLDTIFLDHTEFGSEKMLTTGQMEFYDTTQWYFPGDSMFDSFGYDGFGIYKILDDTLLWKSPNLTGYQSYFWWKDNDVEFVKFVKKDK
jgi:hypothetical protein